MNQLDNYGVIERKGQPVVSSRKVAEVFEREHFHVIRNIESLTETTSGLSEEFRLENFTGSKYKDASGKWNKEYLLTKDGFTMVAMEFKTKKARRFKEAYINRFNQMEDFIKNLYEAKAEFPEFTDAIMAAHEEPKHYHFSNECNMINSIVLGNTAKKYRELNNIEKGKSIRPYLNLEQIESIKALQRIDIGLIVAVNDYQERKKILEQQYNRIKTKKLIA